MMVWEKSDGEGKSLTYFSTWNKLRSLDVDNVMLSRNHVKRDQEQPQQTTEPRIMCESQLGRRFAHDLE